MVAIELQNDYFAYLIGLNGSSEAVEFFSDCNNEYVPSDDEFFHGMLINSYSISEYDSYETHVLLGSWIAEALEVEFLHSYPFNQQKLNILYTKPNYEEVKKSVIKEIKRVYKETQLFLDKAFPNNDDILLFRTLNDMQNEQYLKNQKISYNFITSYCPSRSHTYPGGRTIISDRISKKKILAFTNLSNKGTSLGELENEVIVIHSDQLI